MLADRLLEGGGSSVAFCYAWERKAFPWLMTWEENHSRPHAPWSGKTLCRGMEFGSYALGKGTSNQLQLCQPVIRPFLF